MYKQRSVLFSRSHVTLSHITSPTGNLNVAWRDTPPSAWRNLRNVWHMNEKHSNIVEKANIETFVIAEVNRSQSALYNQKLSGFNFNCVPGCHHILFVGSISPWQSQINPETLRRLVANISISSSFIKTIVATVHKFRVAQSPLTLGALYTLILKCACNWNEMLCKI